MKTNMYEKNISPPMKYVLLRMVVLTLGERAKPAWWNTNFINTTGFSFFERIYPRTYTQAVINSAGKTASEVHDHAVGRVGAFHLFRLPDVTESEIHECLSETNMGLLEEISPDFFNKPQLMEQLKILSGENAADFSPGPKNIGKQSELKTEDMISKMACVYHSAFLREKLSFPYILADRSLGD